MSEQDFELYLTLLAKTLRLSDKQRGAIASELRDHLEARLEELTAEGHDKQQAIATALAEFGDASALANDFRYINQTRTRRRIMKSGIGTLAACCAIALATMYLAPENRRHTPAPTDARAQADPVETRTPAPPTDTANTPARINPIGHAQINADMLALDKDLRFLAQSDAVIEHADAGALPVLTVYGLNFSHDVPRGVYREQTAWKSHADPHYIQVPGVRWGATEVDPLLAEIAEQAEADQLLFAELSAVYTPVAEGSFRITVSLHDEAGQEIDRAEAQMSVSYSGLTDRTPAGHTLQNQLLVFTAVEDVQRVMSVRVAVAEGEAEVRLPEVWGEEAMRVEADPGAGPWETALETERFTRQAEMAALADAVADLNRSMDLHRRFFEQALADPDFAEPREIVHARWKMQSLQSLRSELESRIIAYMLSC